MVRVHRALRPEDPETENGGSGGVEYPARTGGLCRDGEGLRREEGPGQEGAVFMKPEEGLGTPLPGFPGRGGVSGWDRASDAAITPR